MVSFDPTISLGHLAEILIMVVGGIGVIYTLRGDVRMIKEDIVELKEEAGKITDILVTLSGQDERLKHLERSVYDTRQ